MHRWMSDARTCTVMKCLSCALFGVPQSAAEKLGDLSDDQVAVIDIAAEGAADALTKAVSGADALVIASSAVST